MGNTESLPLLGCSDINFGAMKGIMLYMEQDVLARAEDIVSHQLTSNPAHLQLYPHLSCVTCFVLLERYHDLVNGAKGEMTREQVREYARLLLSVAFTMDFILEMQVGHTAVRVVNDVRSILSTPAPEEEDDGPEPVVDQHPDWKEGPEQVSPLVRTSTPLSPSPRQSMVHIMSHDGTIQMPPLPLPTGPLRSLILDQIRRDTVCHASMQLLGLPETMGNKDVGYFVLLLWEFLLRHGLHGPLNMHDITLHTDIVPLISLLKLAPVDKGALLVLQCLFAQVLSVLGYEPNPEEEDDVESLAPLRSLLENPADINMCVEQLLGVLQQQAHGTA